MRLQIQKVCSLPMWSALCDNRREFELNKVSKLRKFWKAIEKADAKLSADEKERVVFERTFLKCLIDRFLTVLKSELGGGEEEGGALESGEIVDPKAQHYRMNYLECFLELIIDLEALLPTRRFFNTLLEDSNLIIECDLWFEAIRKKYNTPNGYVIMYRFFEKEYWKSDFGNFKIFFREIFKYCDAI